MAKLTSSVGYASRHRDRVDARNALSTPSITRTRDGVPYLEFEIRSKERIFRLRLTPEETASVVRLISRELRARYEITTGDLLD